MKRWLIFGAVALLCIIAVFYVLRKSGTAPAGAAPELVELVPAESTAVVYVDLERLRGSQFIARLLAMAPEVKPDREYTEFVAATGFDYSRDLQRVMLAFSNSTGAPKTVALAEGKFDRQKIEKYARANGRVEQFGGVDVHYASREARTAFFFRGGEQVAVIEPSTEVATYLRAVMAMKRNLGPSSELRERIARVSAAPFFAAGRVEGLPLQFGAARSGNELADQVRAILKHVRWYGVAAQPEADALKVLVEGECENMLRAGQLYVLLDSARFVARAALQDATTRKRFPASQIALLEEILNTAKISRDQNRVRLMFAISARSLESK